MRKCISVWKNICKDEWMERWIDGLMDPYIWSCWFCSRTGMRVVNYVSVVRTKNKKGEDKQKVKRQGNLVLLLFLKPLSCSLCLFLVW